MQPALLSLPADLTLCVSICDLSQSHICSFILTTRETDMFDLSVWWNGICTATPSCLRSAFASYHGCALCGKLSGSLWYPGLWRCGPHLWLLPTNRHLQLNVIKVLPVNQLSRNPVGTEYRPECVSLSGGSALLSFVYIQQDWCLLSLIV